jgi:hypothetical protein
VNSQSLREAGRTFLLGSAQDKELRKGDATVAIARIIITAFLMCGHISRDNEL